MSGYVNPKIFRASRATGFFFFFFCIAYTGATWHALHIFGVDSVECVDGCQMGKGIIGQSSPTEQLRPSPRSAYPLELWEQWIWPKKAAVGRHGPRHVSPARRASPFPGILRWAELSAFGNQNNPGWGVRESFVKIFPQNRVSGVPGV